MLFRVVSSLILFYLSVSLACKLLGHRRLVLPPPLLTPFPPLHPFSWPSVMSQGQNFLPKFLFVSNLLKAVKIRQRVPNDVVKPSTSGLMHHLRGMHRYTLEMIAMNHFPQAFREVVQAAILDRAMQASLEQEKKLNWCRELKKMVPLRTNGKKCYFREEILGSMFRQRSTKLVGFLKTQTLWSFVSSKLFCVNFRNNRCHPPTEALTFVSFSMSEKVCVHEIGGSDMHILRCHYSQEGLL